MASSRFTSKISAATIKRFQDGTTDRLVAENVTQSSNGSFRCAIAGAGTCPFGLPKMIQFTFACHFMRQHPKEAAEKGFLEQLGTGKTAQKPASLGMFVVRTERGFCCRIDPDQRCSYTQEDQVSVPSFMRHFRQAHNALAMKHGFCMVADSVEKPPPGKRKRVEESSVDPSDENLWMNAPSDEPSLYCRLCFSIAQPTKQIFAGPEDIGSSCASLIAECAGVQLSAREDHPAAICHECSEKLHDIKRFRTVCETLNRVVCRNRRGAKIEVAPSAAMVSSSPPPLVSIVEPEDEEESLPPPMVPLDETELATSIVENLLTEPKGDPDDVVVELSDSDEDIEDCSAEGPDDEEPYIPLQDDWFCCKLCNKIHQTLDVMIDHLHNYHSEIGFFKKRNAAAANYTNQSKKKSKTKRHKEKTTVVDYQQIVIDCKTYFKCNDCDTLLSQKGNMTRHWRTYHAGTDKRARIFCWVEGCHQNFMDRMGLNRHLKLQHSYDPYEGHVALGRQSPAEV